MNLFVLDIVPYVAARAHHDVHVRKMILETAQMLSTAHQLAGSASACMYKSTHQHHPCRRWISRRAANYRWAYAMFCALCDEYQYRFDKTHLTDTKLRHVLFKLPADLIQDAHQMSYHVNGFVLAMPDIYKDMNTSVGSYRNYYVAEKHLDKNGKWIGDYTKRRPPQWWPHRREEFV